MTTCKNTIFILTIILLSSFLSFATSYTWNGNTNTHWYTSTNWSPGGIPGSGDNVTISGGAGANNLLMDSSKTVTTFTISADSIDVGADTLTITSTATFSGGRIFSSTGGHVKVNSTVTTTFSGTVFNVTLNISSNALLFSGSTFNNTLTAVKNGTSSDNGTGNNIFNGSVTLTNSGTGNLVLSNSTSSPDTFNSTLTVSATNSGGVYLAHQGADNVFNGNVTFSTGKVFSNTYGTAAYNGNITLNSTSGNISFGNSTGSWSLASGKNISIGTFSAGTLTIRNLTQNDSTINMSLVLSGTGILTLGAGNYIRANLYAKSNGLTFTQSRFFGLDTLILTGGTGPFSSGGGNYFGKSVYIANTYAGGNLTWIAGSTSVDTFATKAVLETSGLGTIDIRKGLFLGATTFKNSTTNASDKIYIKDGIFKDSVILNSIYGGISFRQGTGNNLLDSTASLTLSSGFKAHLQLSYLDQRGSHAINFNMTGTSSGTYNQLEIGPGASFQAIFTYLGQGLLLNGGTFSSDASFTRISQQVDVSSGGNIFNGATYICDSVSSTSTIDKPFKLANSIADDFNGNVTFRLYAGGSSPSYVKFYPAYTKNSTFADSVTVDGNAGIDFGANGGKIIFDGSGVQKISKTGTYNPTVKNVDVNKSGGYLKLSVPLAIDTLKLIKGIVVTDTTNIISIPDNGKITSAYGTDGGSDTGYVHGPIKKTGNDAFTFATGDTTLHAYPYHPLKFITTPGASDVYMVQYFGHGSGIADSDTLDSAQVSTCEYWNLKRDVGTTGVKVRLGYTNTCPVGDPARAVVMDYNGSLWQNEGNSAYGGNLVDAADTSLFAAGTSHPVTVGIHSAINVAVVSPAGGTVYSADVRKWEKYEVAVQLPQSYMDCINNYLSHRILHQDTVDHSHDLNPFADDSLIMIMTLQKPGGGTITKYGFFMREVQWLADAPSGDYKTNNDTNSLSDYHIHFRFAPDTLSSSPWIYSIYIAAPFTKVTGTASNLLPIYLGPYFFTCDSLQPENHGFLKVNTNNNRFLIHDDGTPFFGIGDIEADFDKYWDYDGDAYLPKSSGTIYNRLYKTDYDRWKTTIDEIHEAGGNYMCMFFLNRSFKPEYEYLGWYDEFDTMPVSCYYGSGGSPKSGNRQWGLRVFDNLLDEAHAKQVYLQLVLDYEMPGPYQVDGWGGNALVHKYVYPTGIPIGVDTFQAPYAHPEYYWTGKDTSDTNDPGALYWWKRQYKYIMSRWGYSVNIAMYQTTSELDQSLKYHTSSSRDECDTSVTLTYSENSAIPAAYSTFIDTVVGYVKNTLNEHHLFTVSYTPYGIDSAYFPFNGSRRDYYIHFQNPLIDVADIHFYNGDLDFNGAHSDENVQLARYNISQYALNNNSSSELNIGKPFHFGEGSNTWYRDTVIDPYTGNKRIRPISDLYDNYEVTFHNEIWASSFMNSPTCLLTWVGHKVHWWQNALPHAPSDPLNSFQSGDFSNVLDSTNKLSVMHAGTRVNVSVKNKKIYHNYRMLTDYFATSGIDLNDNFAAYNIYDEANGIEVYYMVSSDEKAAYGWVHNVNKYWRNAYYYDVADEQYYWCNDSTASPVTQFKLEHLLTGMYDAEFHPTRMGGQPLPDNQDSLFVISFSPNPYVYIPLTTVTLGCDSLSADFAFKVIQHGSDHRMARNPDKQNHDIQNNTSFVVSPNPNQGSFKIIIPKNDSEHCMLRVYDSQDKLILKKEDLNTELFNLDLSECRKGIYFVQVISNNQSSFKKVVIQ